MHQITGKLTRPKNYKTPEQLRKAKVLREKQEKERIRDEILAAEPVTEMDTKLFSGYLAEKSSKSKSEDEVQQDANKKSELIKQKKQELREEKE